VSHPFPSIESVSKTVLDHQLQPHFEALRECNSTRQLRALPLYRELEEEIERVLAAVLVQDFTCEPLPVAESVHVTGWNVERGLEIDKIARQFQRHLQLSKSDLLLLTELDYGMARTCNRNICRDLARTLSMAYAFAPSYINLNKGSGLEESAEGDNVQALHGNAVFSRFPILEACSIALPNGKDKMHGREKRLGCQRGVFALIDHPLGKLRAVSVHLDAHSTQKHRMYQMRLVLDRLDNWHPEVPALIGGDWNTSTYNSRNAFFSILGYARRVLMGVRNVIQNHFPYPDRWFERHLFRELERRGYNYRDLNEPGACTLHYHFEDLAANGRMADWIPNWCFWFINWALQKNDGRCSMKLDWFAGKGVSPVPGSARVIEDVHTRHSPLSDHDPVVLQLHLEETGPSRNP